jgi:hypothetical protein
MQGRMPENQTGRFPDPRTIRQPGQIVARHQFPRMADSRKDLILESPPRLLQPQEFLVGLRQVGIVVSHDHRTAKRPDSLHTFSRPRPVTDYVPKTYKTADIGLLNRLQHGPQGRQIRMNVVMIA